MEILIIMLSFNSILLLVLLISLIFLARKNNSSYSSFDKYGDYEYKEEPSYIDQDIKSIKEQIL